MGKQVDRWVDGWMDGWVEITGRCYISVRREYLFSTAGFLEEGLSVKSPGLSQFPLIHSISREGVIYLVGKSEKNNRGLLGLLSLLTPGSDLAAVSTQSPLPAEPGVSPSPLPSVPGWLHLSNSGVQFVAPCGPHTKLHLQLFIYLQ